MRKELKVKCDKPKPTEKSAAEQLMMKPKVELTEAEEEEIRLFNEKRRAELYQQLMEFKADSKMQELTFPDKLTSYER